MLEHRVGVFERVMRKTFGSKKDEVTGEWRKLHDQKLHNLYYSPRMTKLRGLKGDGHVAHEEMRNACKILVRKPQGESPKPILRQRRRLDGNIKMDLIQVDCQHVDWIKSVPDGDQWRDFVNVVMNRCVL
jgi:hypothetical protein